MHEHIKKNIKTKKKNNNKNYNRWQRIMVAGEEKKEKRKKWKQKSGNVTSGKRDILMWEK